jgi:hypothetical protein
VRPVAGSKVGSKREAGELLLPLLATPTTPREADEEADDGDEEEGDSSAVAASAACFYLFIYLERS